MGCSKSCSKKEVCSNIILPQETRKTLNRQPNFTLKTTAKRTTTTTRNLQKERNHKFSSIYVILHLAVYSSIYANQSILQYTQINLHETLY